MTLYDVLNESAETRAQTDQARARARPLAIKALQDLATARSQAEAALRQITEEFEDLILTTHENEILTVQEIISAAGIPRSRIYQVAARNRRRQTTTETPPFATAADTTDTGPEA